MTVEALAPSMKVQRRRRALEPYWVKLAEVLNRQPQDGTQPPKVWIGDVSFSLEPWIAARALVEGGATEDDSGRVALLRQCLALWLKGSIDVRNLRQCAQGGSGDLYTLQAELMLDSAFGTALHRELQDHVDDLVKWGEMDEARRFSKFQHQVRCAVREIMQSVTESNGQRGEEPVQTPPDRKASATTPPSTGALLREVDDEPSSPRPRRRRTQALAAAARGASKPFMRTGVLVGLDVAALLVCGFVTARSFTVAGTPPALTQRDFPNASSLVDVVARPPALYATVDGKAWSGYDAPQKRHFVDGLGNVLLSNGYWGLLLKTPDGQLVGEWLENGGTRLLGTGQPALEAAGSSSSRIAPAAAQRVASRYSRFVP